MQRKAAGAPSATGWPELRRAFACWLAIVACIAAMPLVGFAIAFALLTWFIVAIMARQSQAKAITIAISGAVAFQVLFETLLEVSLPHGLLF